MFPPVVASLLLMVSPAVPVVSCGAVGPVVDVFLQMFLFVQDIPAMARVSAVAAFPTAVEVSLLLLVFSMLMRFLLLLASALLLLASALLLLASLLLLPPCCCRLPAVAGVSAVAGVLQLLVIPLVGNP